MAKRIRFVLMDGRPLGNGRMCAHCMEEIKPGETVWAWSPTTKSVICGDCYQEHRDSDPHLNAEFRNIVK